MLLTVQERLVLVLLEGELVREVELAVLDSRDEILEWVLTEPPLILVQELLFGVLRESFGFFLLNCALN